MIMIRAFIQIFEVDSRIRRYRARFCNGRRPLIYQADPLPPVEVNVTIEVYKTKALVG